MSANTRSNLKYLLAATAVAGCLARPELGNAQDRALRLSSTTHGVAFDQDNRPILLDAKTILVLQEGTIQSLRARLDKATAAQFDAARKAAAVEGDEGQQIYANAVAIGALIAKTKPEDEATLQTRNIKLLSRYGGLIGKPVSVEDLLNGKPPVFARKKIDPIFKGLNDGLVFGPIRRPYTYAAQCAAAGVPVPPPLNVSSPGGGWVNAGEQKVSYLEPKTMHPNKFSQMFYWIPANASGICIANPIVEDKVAAPTSINAFGVICQSVAKPNKPSHACFWDNATDSMDINVAHDIRKAADFIAPPHLPADNQCTDCHAGGHAFIVMPASGIHKGNDGNQALVPSAIEDALNAYDNAHTPNFHSQENYYKPLVDASWPQNVLNPYPSGAASDPNDGATCGGCHGPNGGFGGKTLPNVTGPVLPRDNLFKFCSFILPDFLTSVHDPSHYYDGAMRNEATSNPGGVTALYNACQAVFPGGYFPASQSSWLVHRDPP